MPSPAHTTPTLERVVIEPGPDRTSLWLWRHDLALLRALYRGRPGGYSTHVREATHDMCNRLRAQLRTTPSGCELLRKLGQDHLQ